MEYYNKDFKNMPYEELVRILSSLTADEIMIISNKIGYPVFTRLCMGELKHKFVLLQDGAVAFIENSDGDILLQRRSDREIWGLPGGCQELGETFEDTIIREVLEETNLNIVKDDLVLVGIASGMQRKNSYPNGDVVINNTVVYKISEYSGELKWNNESKEMKFFSVNNIPKEFMEPDLLEMYINYKTVIKK